MQLIEEFLKDSGLRYFTDDEGDLGAYWEGYRVYFMLLGEEKEIYWVRAYYHRRFPPDRKDELVDAVNDWNRTRYWPKLFTRSHDDHLTVAAEALLDCEVGIDRALFFHTNRCWLGTMRSLRDWLGERMGPEL
jgi:predicted glycosyltransferase involved in capsule biosynthesis